MQPAVLHALEFDRIREALAHDALTPLGRARALALEPSPDPAEVAHRLNATSEAVALLADGGSLSISAPEELLALLDALQVGGQPLEPMGLVGLATFVESVDAVCAGVRRLRASMPLLSDVADAAAAWKTSHFEGRVENLYHVGWTVALAYAAEQIIGFLYFRSRPFVALEGAIKLIEKSPLEKSFPSGHATAAFAMAFGLLLHNRKWGWALVVLALYVSLSRIAVGVHYPSDVAGGMIVAALAAMITAPVKKAIEPYLELFPVFRKYRRQV